MPPDRPRTSGHQPALCSREALPGGAGRAHLHLGGGRGLGAGPGGRAAAPSCTFAPSSPFGTSASNYCHSLPILLFIESGTFKKTYHLLIFSHISTNNSGTRRCLWFHVLLPFVIFLPSLSPSSIISSVVCLFMTSVFMTVLFYLDLLLFPPVFVCDFLS